jgi:hypothetical protein
MAFCGSDPSTIRCFSSAYTSCYPVFCRLRILTETGDLGKAAPEIEGRRTRWKTSQLLEGPESEPAEIRSLGNLSYANLADLLFTPN